MRYSFLLALAGAFWATPIVQAQTAKPDDPVKHEIFGGGMGIGYALDHCDIPTTATQRADFAAKMKDLKQKTGERDMSPDELKGLLKIKTSDDEKKFCRFVEFNFPAMLAGLLAEKPMDEWNVRRPGASTTEATPTPAAPAAAPSTPGKVTVGDWEVEPVADAPGVCQIARGYNDKTDNTIENAIVIRRNADSYVLALVHSKWTWKLGQTVSAPLVTPNGPLNGNAELTGDKTGQVLTTPLPFDSKDKMRTVGLLTVKLPEGDVAFEVPKLGEALEAMETCAKQK